MNNFYPFYFISDFFYECDEENIKTKKPTFNLQFPKEPKIENTWEFFFGISKWKLIKYENDKTEFKNQRNVYEKNLIKYETDVRKEIIQFHKNTTEEVKKKYESFFEKNLDLKFIDDDLKTGVGERIFRNELINEFGDKVLVNKKIVKVLTQEPLYFDEHLVIPQEDEEYEIGNPDFLLVLNHSNLRIVINIEIDEPYIAESGEIIHYINDEDDKNKDSYVNFRRDLRFNENGIIVLRYSEEQVVKYPKNVVEDIKSFTSNILNFKYPYYTFESEITKSKRWTKNEAIDLSNNNFRNSYLINNEIPSAKERGLAYKIESLNGAWYEDEDGSKLYFYKDHLITEFDIQLKNFVRLTKIDNKSKEEVNYLGFVSLKKDRLKLSFTKRNGRFLGKTYGFTWDLQILKLTNEIFDYKEIEKDKIYKTRRI
ncbi:hypothetical protein [Confluentibacter citreus]|uniref:hypothetical protein n=1 Tax=Confluentibacter citreus TaxID=2007307 RepID=UPI000C2844BE|nr:hypothetical protein [Confluentibacter citreus]